MRSKVTDRGQVTIPKALRQRYGIREGTEVEFVAEQGGLRLCKAAGLAHPVRKVFGLLRKAGSTDDYIEKIRGR